jgi:DNA (cytosine-5)-methyltransferase 1
MTWRTTRRRGTGKQPSFLAVDFFCGAGGTTRGLIDAGGYIIAGIDKDVRCRETYIDNNRNGFVDYCEPRFLACDVFPKSPKYTRGQQAELRKELDMLIPYYRAKAKGVPLLFAICAPCQPFTRLARKELTARRKAARRRDKNLLGEAMKFVRRYKPELVLSENVQGIGDPKYGGVWQEFREALERAGYVTGHKVVCTSRFGIPQYRRRSILLGVRRDIADPDRLQDTDGKQIMVPEFDADAVMMSVREAIGHLPPIVAGELHPKIPNHRARTLSKLNLKRLAAAKPGESNKYLESTRSGDLSLRCHKKVNRKVGTRCFTDVYTRMRPDKPSPTITTKCHSITNGRFGHYDIRQLRGISLREAAVLQSFPEDYVFYPRDQVEPIARMIGNAVPPKLARFYSRYLANSVERRAFARSRRRAR